jgi:hypothetical protein
MIQLAMTPEQFAKAKMILAAPQTDIRSFSETGPVSGSFATVQVGFRYIYDGIGALALSVTAKHGAAMFATEDEIKGRLVALLAKMQTT